MKKLLIFFAALALILSGCETDFPETAETPIAETGLLTEEGAETTEEENLTEIADIVVTVEENSRISDIVPMLAEKVGGDADTYLSLLKDGDFPFSFTQKLKETGLSDGRLYLYEGYLMPGEYSIPEGSDESETLEIILSRFEDFWDEEAESAAEKLGLTMDEAVTVASVVEIETADNADCPATASVFLNRLESPDFPKLQSDRTVLYVLDGFGRSATNDDVKLDSPYNTYMYGGLMPSAVCSPSREALEGTLHPEETDYYYFINCHNGRNAYASDYEEHKANYRRYLDGEL